MSKDVFRTFNKIYEEGFWGRDEEGIGYSGPGSSVMATTSYRLVLEQLIRDLDVHSVVDAGCGDWTYARAVNWQGAHYLGFDASRVAIEKARRFSSPLVAFELADVTEDLPSADLLLCKDVLQHLPNHMVQSFIQKNLLRRNKYKWAVITNDLGDENRDIEVGDHRPLNLALPPFNVNGLVDLGVGFAVPGGKVSQLLYLW